MGNDGHEHETEQRERKMYACMVTEVKGDTKREVKKGMIIWITEHHLNYWVQYITDIYVSPTYFIPFNFSSSQSHGLPLLTLVQILSLTHPPTHPSIHSPPRLPPFQAILYLLWTNGHCMPMWTAHVPGPATWLQCNNRSWHPRCPEPFDSIDRRRFDLGGKALAYSQKIHPLTHAFNTHRIKTHIPYHTHHHDTHTLTHISTPTLLHILQCCQRNSISWRLWVILRWSNSGNHLQLHSLHPRVAGNR